MRTIKDRAFFSRSLSGRSRRLTRWTGWRAGPPKKGYKALQIPCNHPHIFDVEKSGRKPGVLR